MMDVTPTYWEDNSNIQRVKYESCGSHDDTSRMKDERGLYACCETNLNFSTATCSEDDCEYGPYKKNKITRQDPMSHRIIEKRRRDRMNNCLADLSRLIPTEYLKKGRGRIEKTEIIEMAIKYMKYLQQDNATPTEHYRLGYQECMSEVMRFMVEVEGRFPREAACVRLLGHLQQHCDSISRAFGPDRRCSAAAERVVPGPSTPEGGAKAGGFKAESEPNNNAFMVGPPIIEDPPKMERSPDSDYEKHQPAESNGVLYKYKTNIKLRFSQDVNGTVGQEAPKGQKVGNGRRSSLTSMENQSLSHSPPVSDACPRTSDSDLSHRRSPSDTASSTHNHPGGGPPPPCPPAHALEVPVFALHAGGGYYVPLTVDRRALAPFLRGSCGDPLGAAAVGAAAARPLHPVTISVDFCAAAGGRCKTECDGWH